MKNFQHFCNLPDSIWLTLRQSEALGRFQAAAIWVPGEEREKDLAREAELLSVVDGTLDRLPFHKSIPLAAKLVWHLMQKINEPRLCYKSQAGPALPNLETCLRPAEEVKA